MPAQRNALIVKGYAHVFTWSQCAEVEEDAREFQANAFDTVQSVFRVSDTNSWITCGVEQHEDGNYHVHLGLVRVDNKAVKVGRRLDIEGVHPNVSPHVPTIDSKRAALRYPLKEDEEPIVSFDEDIEELFEADTSTNGNSRNGGCWALALEADTYEGALDIIKSNEPKEFILRHREITTFFEAYFTPPFKPTYAATDFVVDPIDWENVPMRNSVVICGPPNIGKSQYALAQLGENPLFVSHMDFLTKFKPACHTGILFDEVSFKKFPPTSFISVLDRELPRQIHCRYRVATIPPGTKKIICVNDLANVYPENADGDTLAAIEDRMTIIRLTDTTF